MPRRLPARLEQGREVPVAAVVEVLVRAPTLVDSERELLLEPTRHAVAPDLDLFDTKRPNRLTVSPMPTRVGQRPPGEADEPRAPAAPTTMETT